MIYAKEIPAVAKTILGEKLFNQLQAKYDALGIEGGKGHTLYYEKYYRSYLTAEEKANIAQESRDYYAQFR